MLADTGTIVELDGFGTAYQKSAHKTAAAIAREVFEHCIWYFLRPGGARLRSGSSTMARPSYSGN